MADKFSELAYAQAFRDVIRDFVQKEVNFLRPRTQFATVQSIDAVNHKCSVLFTGDTTPVIVRMYTIRPAAAGAVVRLEGTGNSRYITEVVSGSCTLFTGAR